MIYFYFLYFSSVWLIIYYNYIYSVKLTKNWDIFISWIKFLFLLKKFYFNNFLDNNYSVSINNKYSFIKTYGMIIILILLILLVWAPVAQWVVCLTHNQLVPGSKHAWCKNPLVFAMIATWTIGLAAQCLNWFPSSVQPNMLKGLAKFLTISSRLCQEGHLA